jgi:hypothetical protein
MAGSSGHQASRAVNERGWLTTRGKCIKALHVPFNRTLHQVAFQCAGFVGGVPICRKACGRNVCPRTSPLSPRAEENLCATWRTLLRGSEKVFASSNDSLNASRPRDRASSITICAHALFDRMQRVARHRLIRIAHGISNVAAQQPVERSARFTRRRKIVAGCRASCGRKRETLSESRMREIWTSGSLSGRWKRSMTLLVRHRQTKGSVNR